MSEVRLDRKGEEYAAEAAPDQQEPAGDPALEQEHPLERSDWRWVEQWRAGGEPTPWGHGLVLTLFTALLVAVAVYVLSAGLSDRPIVAALVNVIVAAGVAPAVWLSRGLPVLRWIAAGTVLGVLAGWLSLLMFLTG